ncbi:MULTISPECIES: EamA family transporter RarD [Providencia]|uniref:Protein RarD n=2 Tax=Providencia rustigianii TaxID=158850 RepID=D1P4M2_9GAMM|nr:MULTISPECIES: EamA family transporter RarD [Providencia]EFB71848.1 protein RarD [Providencia rustigianii DSM 4541]MTC55565.1 EamA family transporter RarD [Providencia rustigianii]MTC60603.1 EamA family transporter RarD [Providencia rustigianii]SPY78550.1 putative chloramphenical resistance permease RarD [Providencia rustigianii]SUC28190.1 putative chloramphenical resistance permease RarD [Providencia rustigianii]
MLLRSGVALAIFSYILWGITPLFYRLLPDAQAMELLAQRLIWSIPFLFIIRLAIKNKSLWKQVWADKRSILLCLFSSSIMAISWTAFTYALTHGQVLAASLGYFINPLFSILLGVIFLRERLVFSEKMAVLFIFAGVMYQIFQYGELPALALVMGSAFAVYGLIRKFIRFDVITSLFIEALWLLPLAIGITWWLSANNMSAVMNGDWQTKILYMLAAPVTIIPLLFFTAAIKRTTLTVIGLAQYIEPTIQFLLAVFLFNELFDWVKGVSFSLIWIGLLFCILALIHKRYAKGHERQPYVTGRDNPPKI